MPAPVFPIAEHWFDRTKIDDSTTLLIEPHVIELMRCNIWHVRGRDRDLIVDTGMGVCSLLDEITDLLDKPVVGVATHSHDDHIGSHHEFDDVRVHPLEAQWLSEPYLQSLHIASAWSAETIDGLTKAGYPLDAEYFVTALPAGYALDSYRIQPCANPRPIAEGDVIDLGDRAFEVLHLPGHSPGSIGLWDAESGTLFSGDAIYDGPLLDEGSDSNIADYITTMEQLLTLPVEIVHGGHDPSFDRRRFLEIATAYLSRRRPA